MLPSHTHTLLPVPTVDFCFIRLIFNLFVAFNKDKVGC